MNSLKDHIAKGKNRSRSVSEMELRRFLAANIGKPARLNRTQKQFKWSTAMKTVLILGILGLLGGSILQIPSADEKEGREREYGAAGAEQSDSTRRVEVGGEIPDFELVVLGEEEKEGSGKVVSKTSMKGKYYLIDFWATWCGPCINEMDQLHRVYEKFGGDRFQILSLSFDETPDKVEHFRKTKWEMPWLHTIVKGGTGSDLAARLEVRDIPKPILVDPNGIIIALDADLRGERLEQTLARHLGDEQVNR